MYLKEKIIANALAFFKKDGTLKYPNGDTLYPNGSIKHPDDSVSTPEGSTLYPDGITIDKDGYMTMSQNQTQKYAFVSSLYTRYKNVLKRYNKDVLDWKITTKLN